MFIDSTGLMLFRFPHQTVLGRRFASPFLFSYLRLFFVGTALLASRLFFSTVTYLQLPCVSSRSLDKPVHWCFIYFLLRTSSSSAKYSFQNSFAMLEEHVSSRSLDQPIPWCIIYFLKRTYSWSAKYSFQNCFAMLEEHEMWPYMLMFSFFAMMRK